MSTRSILGGKGVRCVGVTTVPLSCADCLKNQGASHSWIPKGLSWPLMGLLYLFFNVRIPLNWRANEHGPVNSKYWRFESMFPNLSPFSLSTRQWLVGWRYTSSTSYVSYPAQCLSSLNDSLVVFVPQLLPDWSNVSLAHCVISYLTANAESPLRRP
jgi:hypothetical protein